MLAERWNGKLFAHAWRLTGSAELAGDATQSASVHIVRGLHWLAGRAGLPGLGLQDCLPPLRGTIGAAVRGRQLASSLAGEPGGGVRRADPDVDR